MHCGPSSYLPWPPSGGAPGFREGGRREQRGLPQPVCAALVTGEFVKCEESVRLGGYPYKENSSQTRLWAFTGVLWLQKASPKIKRRVDGPGGALPKACPRSGGCCPGTQAPVGAGPGLRTILPVCSPADNEMGFTPYTVVLWAMNQNTSLTSCTGLSTAETKSLFFEQMGRNSVTTMRSSSPHTPICPRLTIPGL